MTESLEMQLFLEALDLPRDERSEFIGEIDDASLRSRVSRLLEADAELSESGRMDPEAQGGASPALAMLQDVHAWIGSQFDGLRIVAVLGRGGMGVVFDAEQVDSGRRVALKTLPSLIGRPDAARRLEMEARLLARLSHPGIAEVYGSGVCQAHDGQPYVILERVVGLPIDQFARERDLDQRSCLELIVAVGNAVAHAHGRGVIHRDLKPANILVTAEGAPKVLDFGIARLLDDAGQAPSISLRTRTGQIVGTLSYMSPEQLSSDSAQLDVRSDVYSLGIICWQLLAGGRLPIDVDELSLVSAVRRLSEARIPRVPHVDRSLRGDLELVVATALEHDLGRRYETVAEFTAEIRRVLSGLPVIARPPSRIYLLRGFVRRHGWAVAATLVMIFGLSIGLGLALYQRELAVAARFEADETAHVERLRTASMGELLQLLTTMVEQANEAGANGGEATMSEVVDRLASMLEGAYTNAPQVSGMAHLLVARSLAARDELDRAMDHIDACRSAFERSELAMRDDFARVSLLEARLAVRGGRMRDALAILEKVHSSREALGPELQAYVAGRLGRVLSANHRDAERAIRLCRESQRKLEILLGADHSATQRAGVHLAAALAVGGRDGEALRLRRKLVADIARIQPGSMNEARARADLGHSLLLDRQFVEASDELLRAVRMQRSLRRDSAGHSLGVTLDNLACSLRDQGDVERAFPLFGEAERILARRSEPGDAALAICREEWGVALLFAGQLEKADEKLRQAIAWHDAQPPGSVGPAAASARERLATVCLQREAVGDAIELAKAAAGLRKSIHGAEHWLCARPLEVLATAYFMDGKLEGAERTARRMLELRQSHYGESAWQSWSDSWIVWTALARRGELEAALDLNGQALGPLRAGLGASHPRHLRALGHRVDLLRAVGRAAAADTAAAELERLQKAR